MPLRVVVGALIWAPSSLTNGLQPPRTNRSMTAPRRRLEIPTLPKGAMVGELRRSPRENTMNRAKLTRSMS